MATAIFAAAILNGLVAVASACLALRAPHACPSGGTAPNEAEASRGVLAAIALSGLCALGAEVVWTRLLSLMLGATVYTFSIILAVFLVGLGIGSAAGAWLSRARVRPAVALAGCQLLLAAAVAWAAYMLATTLPYWHVPARFASPWEKFRIDVTRCVLAILPATCLWGASFPLALAAAARRGQDPGRLVGRAYAANTAGAIAGALAFSMLLIPWTGTLNCQRLLMGVPVVAALFVLVPLKPRLPGRAIFALAALIVATALLARNVPAMPWGVIAYGRQMQSRTESGRPLYVDEGMNASVVVSESDVARSFHVSGKVEASSGPQDMRLQRMLGHIPALVHPRPRSVLVVGCGAGVTAGTFVTYPEVERIVICEIEPRIPPAAARFFDRENYGVVSDPRVEIVPDDARHFILTTREKFDIITSDPIHPWVRGSATLYTQEYFELCRRRLNPGGVISQWVPLYESSPEAVESELATFFKVFPGGTVWANETVFAEGYDTVLLGGPGAASIHVDEMETRFGRPDHARVAASLEEVGFASAAGLLTTYTGQAPDFADWLRHAEINRDGNLRLQYLAGLGLDLQRADQIYDEMLRRRRYPERLFVASPVRLHALREALRLAGGQ